MDRNCVDVEASLAIANALVELAQKAGRTITPMQLLKQVYFAHGWHLALTGLPLLDERVEAWQFGPVAPSVYHAFKSVRAGQITQKATELDTDRFEYVAPMPKDPNVMPLLKRISDVYGRLSGARLSAITHQDDSPWFRTWNDGGGKDRKNTDIPDEEIKQYFCKKLKTVTPPAAG